MKSSKRDPSESAGMYERLCVAKGEVVGNQEAAVQAQREVEKVEAKESLRLIDGLFDVMEWVVDNAPTDFPFRLAIRGKLVYWQDPYTLVVRRYLNDGPEVRLRLQDTEEGAMQRGIDLRDFRHDITHDLEITQPDDDGADRPLGGIPAEIVKAMFEIGCNWEVIGTLPDDDKIAYDPDRLKQLVVENVFPDLGLKEP